MRKQIITTLSGGGMTNHSRHAGVYKIDREALKAEIRREWLKATALFVVYIGIVICCVTLLMMKGA
jgi:cell division protein FtsX